LTTVKTGGGASGDVYALRLRATIDVNQNDATESFNIRSGGLLTTGATLSIDSRIFFGDGATPVEARVYNTVTTTLANRITASGLTKGGAGALALSPGAGLNGNLGNLSTLVGPIVVNAGTLQVGHQFGLGGGNTTNPYATGNSVYLWGGVFQPSLNSTFYRNDLNVMSTSTFAPSQANTKIQNLTVNPYVVGVNGTDGSATSTGTSLTIATQNAYVANSFNVAGNVLLTTQTSLLIEGTPTNNSALVNGAAPAAPNSIDKWGNGTLAILGNSPTYTGKITVYQGALQSQDARASSTPFGSGLVDVMPGAIIRLAAPTNVVQGIAADGSTAALGSSVDVDDDKVVSVSVPSNAGKYYHTAPYVFLVGGGGSGATAEARLDPRDGSIIGIDVTNPGSGYSTAPDVMIGTFYQGDPLGMLNDPGSQLAIHSDRAGLGVLSMMYGGRDAALPTGVQFNNYNGLYGGVVAIDTVGFTADLDLSTVTINRLRDPVGDPLIAGTPFVYLGSTLGGTFQGTSLAPTAGATFYLGGGGGLLNINTFVLGGPNTVYIGALSNENVYESLAMAQGGGNVAFNNLTAHRFTRINGGGTLTIGTYGVLDQTERLAFNGNTHPVFSGASASNALLQVSPFLGRATVNTPLTINTPLYFFGDLGVNTNNGNDVIFSGQVNLGLDLEDNVSSGASRFFNIGNTSGNPGRVYFTGGIGDGVGINNQVVKQGTGVMHMSGNNTYTGNTFLLNGFIALSNDEDIPDESFQSVFMQGGGLGVWESAPLNAQPANRTFDDKIIIYPQNTGPFGIANVANGFGVVDVGPGLKYSQTDGSISGGGTLIKQGLGTMVLGDAAEEFKIANAITGITVNGGVLQFDTFAAAGDQTQPNSSAFLFTGTTAAGNATVTLTGLNTTAGLAPGMAITGQNIPGDTRILQILSATQFTLTNNALAAGAGAILRSGGFSFTSDPTNLAATTNGQPVVTVTTTDGLVPGMLVYGPGIPAGASILSIISGTQFDLTANATATTAVGAEVSLTFTTTELQGDLFQSNPVVNVGSVRGLSVGMTVAGSTIPAGTLITAINTTTNEITLSAAPTADAALATIGVNVNPANIGNNGTLRFNFTNTTSSAYARNMQASGGGGLGIDVTSGNTFHFGASLQTAHAANAVNRLLPFRKTGAGTFITEGTNTATAIEVYNGTWQFADANAGWADNARVTIGGGKILLAGTSPNAAESINFNGGGYLSWTAGANATVNLTNLVRAGQGTLVLEPDAALGGSQRLVPTNMMFNGGAGITRAAASSSAPATSAGIYSPFFIMQSGTPGNVVGDFLMNHATGGVVPYSGAYTAAGSLTSSTTTALGNFTTPVTITGDKAIFAFKTTADVNGTGRLYVSSMANTTGRSEVGGILINGNVAINANLYFDSNPAGITASAPNANSGEGVIYVAPGKTGTLNGDLFARGLTKFGGGTLVLNNDNEILGNVTVQDGTLKIGPNAVGTAFATSLAVNSTGVLDLNGLSYAFESLGTTGGAAGGVITTSNGAGRLVINGLNNQSGLTVHTGTYTSGTNRVTITPNTLLNSNSTAGDLFVGMPVSGTGIPAGTFITSIASSNQVTLSANTTAAGTNAVLSFGAVYEGRLTDGAAAADRLRLVKVGLGTLTLGSYNSINPDAGNNTHTGGTEVQGGTLTVLNPLNLGGADNTAPGDVDLFGGTLNFKINGGNNNGVIVIGNQNTAGLRVNLFASSSIAVSNAGATTGNAIQVGELYLSGATLTLTGGNNYSFKVAGDTIIGDKSADAWTDIVLNSNGPSGVMELGGKIVGGGLMYLRGSTNNTLRTLIVSGNSDTTGADAFTGNVIVAGGALQLRTGTTGQTPIGAGRVTVLGGGQLRLASDQFLAGGTTGKVVIGSQVNSWAGIGLDTGFTPTQLNATNFSSKYGVLLQITTPFMTQNLNMAQIGDGRAFLGAGLNFEAGLNNAQFLPGLADSFVDNQMVYRLTGGTGANLALVGQADLLIDSFDFGSSGSFLQVGPIANNLIGTVTGTGNSVIFRQGNDFSRGTQIVRGLQVVLDTGAFNDPALGSGVVEIYGALTLGSGSSTGYGGVSSFLNAAGNNYNAIVLRPGGQILINDVAGQVAGGEGRWDDTAPLKLNGGTFRFEQVNASAFVNGALNTRSYEVIGPVEAGKGGALRVVRVNGSAGSASLVLGGLTRGAGQDRGTLLVTNSQAIIGGSATATSSVLGIVSSASAQSPNSYDRLIVTGGAAVFGGLAGKTIIGAGVTGSYATAGVAPLWMIDATNHSYLTYNPAAGTLDGDTGFQTLLNTPSPGVGQVSFSNRVTSGTTVPALSAGSVVDIGTFFVGGGSTTNTSQSVNVGNTANLVVGMPITGTGIPAGTTITAINSATNITISAAATATNANLTFTANGTGVTLGANPTLYAMRLGQNLNPSGSNNTITFSSGTSVAAGGILFNNTTGTATISTQTASSVTNPMTLAFAANEAIIYVASGGTGTINAQITGTGGLTKFGAGSLVLNGSNALTGGLVVHNGGLLQLNNPVAADGTTINNAIGNRDIVLNGNGAGTGTGQAGTTTLTIDHLLSSSTVGSIAGNRDSIMASGSRITGFLNNTIFVNGDSVINNAGSAVYQRINNLTFATLTEVGAAGGSDARSLVQVNFSQAGIRVSGTTTLGANSNAMNVAFSGMGMVMLDGVVAGGAGGRLIKTGNGMLFFNNAANSFGADGKIGLEVWASTQNTATSIVGSTLRGPGNPFGVGDVNLLPGTMIRLAAASNIAGQKVYAYSDTIGISGVSFAYHTSPATKGLSQADIMNVLTTTPTDGKVSFSSTGGYLGVVALDNGWQYNALDLGAMETALGGKLWLGSSTANQVYFAPTLQPGADNVYRLGGGGNQGTLIVGLNAFENVLTGNRSVVVGANDFGFNAVSYVNGNSNVTLRTRNNFTGDITAERDSTLNIENSFALGTGKLLANQASDVTAGGGAGGLLQTSGGIAVAINNDVDVIGDLRWNGGNDFVIRGNVNLAPTGVGGTRVLQVGVSGAAVMSILGVVSGDRSNLVKSGSQTLVLNNPNNSYSGTTQLAGTGGSLLVGADVLPNQLSPLGQSDSPVIITASSTTINSVGLGLSGQVTFGRDIIVQNSTAASFAGVFGNTIYTSRLTGNIAVVATGADRDLVINSVANGRLEVLGAVTSNGGTMRVRMGDTGTTRVGMVYLGPGPNGTSLNNYQGNTILDNGRIIVGANAQYTGATNNLAITSSPFGTGSIMLGSTANGTSISPDGASRIIPNALSAIAVAGNSAISFFGRGDLSFISTGTGGTTTNWDLNTNGALRNRTFNVNTSMGAVSFATNYTTNNGAFGANLLKTGPGVLVMNGSSTVYNEVLTDGNYGTSWFIDAGVLRVSADASLGANTVIAKGTGSAHVLTGQASDVRLRGGTLSVAGTFLTAHQFIQTAASTIDVSAGNTLTQSYRVTGAFGLTKIGAGTLMLNATANANTSLTVGNVNGGGGTVATQASTGNPFGAAAAAVTLSGGTLRLVGVTGTAPGGVIVGTAQGDASFVLNVSNSAGIVPGMTVAGTNIPAGTIVTGVDGNAIRLSNASTADVASGTALTFGLQAQDLSLNTLNYAGAAGIELVKGTGVATSTLRVTNAFARQTYGMLTLTSSNLSTDLGVNERLFATNPPANLAGNTILSVPSIVGRASGGSDLNFLRYDAATGFRLHTAATVATLGASAATSVADLGSNQAVANSAIDVYALRTASNVTSGGGSSLLRIASGGIIFNGTASPTISAPLRFGTLAATPQEALVWVGNTTGLSTISGGFTATDFTKAGPGTLLISGTNNVMTPLSDAQRAATLAGTTITVADTTDLSVGMAVSGFNGATAVFANSVITNILSPTQFTINAGTGTITNVTVSGLRRVTIQDGTLRFAGQSSVPSGGNVIIAVNNAGVFDLNNQNLNIGGLNGTGTVTNSGGSLRTLSVNMDLSQVLAFNGQITGNLALEKTGIGTLTIAPPMNKDGASFGNTYTGGTTVNAGQIVGAHIFAPSSLGMLTVQNVMGLGTGDITLKGGIVDFSVTGTGTLAYVGNEIVDAINTIQVGPNNGYNVVVPRLNNFGTLNTTSAIGLVAASPTAWSRINNVTLDAPSLTWVGQATNVMVDGTFNVTYDDGDAGTLYDEVFLNTAGSGIIAGQILAENKTLVKAGAGTLFLTNGQVGDLRNKVHQWKIMAGALELRIANGASSPLGSAAEINMNNSTLNVRLEGDNTTAMQVLTTFADNSILVGTQVGIASRSYLGSGNTVLSTDRLGSGANKTVVFKDLNFGGALGSPYFSYNSGNGYTTIFSNLTMVKDAYLAVNNLSMTIDGGISGAGTLYKQGGAALFVNSANPGFKGGTVVSQGTLFFGKFEGVVTTLNETANVGTGNLLVNPGAAVQFNSINNIVAGWTGLLDVRSNALGSYGIVRLATDETLDAFHFRLGNLGGPQTTSYFGLAGGPGLDGLGKNVGAAIIALNTVYTKAIDMRRIGDGTAFLGSTSNQVGRVGSYNAATLGVGAGNTYRLGGGGSTLYIQSTMAASNVLTGAGANLVVGTIHSGMNVDTINGGNGRGTVVLMTDNNYTGSTTVNRGSTLEFRGALTTSSFETWGLLTAAGFGGTFVNAAGSANLGSVTTRPGSEIRFDNASGLLPSSAAQGRWHDSTAITLDNSILRIIGNRDVETSETVGMVTVVGQGTILAQRDYPSRQTALVLGGITAGANATLSIQPATGAQLGNDERVLLSAGSAGLPDIVLPGQGVVAGTKFRNGMIAPWVVNIGEMQFLTYTADNGFVNAGFNRIRTGALGTTSASTERVFMNAASTIVGGAGNFDVYALRLDGDVTFASGTAAAADRITILSGTVLANGTRTFLPGIQFGQTSNPTNAYIVNNGTFTIGDSTRATATGQLTNASGIHKFGAGTLQIDAAQASFTGNWIINQGSLFLRSRTAQANLGGAASAAQLAAFSNGVVQMNAFDTTLGLRTDVAGTIFNVSLVLGPNNPQVRLTADRGPINTASSVLAQLGGSIRFSGSPGEQGQTLFITSGNSYTLQVNGGVDLGPAGNAFIRTDVLFNVQGKLTGAGTLVKTGGSTLDLNGITPANGANDNTGGIQMVLGTLNVRGGATTANAFPNAPLALNYGGFGSGAFTVWGGTTNIRIDGSNNTTRERYWVGNNAAGNSLIVNGSATIDINRQGLGGATGTNKHMAFKDLTIGGATLGLTGGSSYVFEINGGTTLVGSPVLNVSSAPLFLNGAVSDGGSKQIIVKAGGTDLWLNDASSRFGGLLPGTYGPNGLGLVVNGGLLRFGGVATETPTLNLSTMLNGSRIRINSTGNWRLMTPNVAIGVGQIQQYAVAPQLSLARIGTSGVTAAQIQSWFTPDSSGVLAFEVTTLPATLSLNLGAIGDGTFRLGAVGASNYTALALGVGAGNVYRIGGAGSTLTLDSSGVTTGALIESAPGTRVEFGSQAVSGNGTVTLNDVNTYTGGSVVSRSMVVNFSQAPTAVAGPLGNGGAIDVFGTLVATGAAASFQKSVADANANFYNVRLHPGSILRLDNNGANNNDRWANNVAITLDGATLNVVSRNDTGGTVEQVGAVSFSRGATIQINRGGLFQNELTLASLTRQTPGSTLVVLNSSALGQAGTTAQERLLVSAWALQPQPLYGTVNPGAGASTGILPGYYIDGTTNSFLSYNTATGFRPLVSTASPGANVVAYSKIINFGDIATVDFSSGQDTLDVNGSAFTIVRDFAVFAMRSSVSITSGVGQYNTITFSDAPGGGRGGLITTAAIAIQADLKFGNAGLSDAYVYNTTNLTINGDIYASSVTKFGAGNMILAKDQTEQARQGVGLLGNWYVNQGTLQLNTFGASGNGRIFLNASGPNTAAGTTLNLSANAGSPLSGTYTMSGITIVDNAVINVNAGGADRTVTIGDLEIVSTDVTGLQPARARFVVTQTRSMVNAGVLTLTGGASILDVNANSVNNQITSGATAGVAVAGLVGTQNLIKWGNGGLYLLGDNSATFSGDVIVEQGALRVTAANALGNAATDVTVRRYGTFDLWAAGVAKVPTYEAGAIERWSIDGARGMALLDLGPGTLQVNADQFSQTNTTVRLNGGAIEGFLRTDDSLDSNIGVVYRTLGAGVKFELQGDSFVGQNPLIDGPNGLDNGRSNDLQPGLGAPGVNNSSSLTDSARGVILEIKGVISGTGGLTKQSGDTVILSGVNTYQGATNITGGTLRVGIGGALPNQTNLTTYGSGVLDLSGNNVTVGGLSAAVVGGAQINSSGFITNSATTLNTFTVGNGATADFIYGGVIQNNISLVKTGPNKQTLTNVNTYYGETTVSGGALTVTHVDGAGNVDGVVNTTKLSVGSGAAFNILTGATTGSNLTLAPTSGTVLDLANNSRLGFQLSGTGGATSGKLTLQAGALAHAVGNVFIDAYFNSTYTVVGNVIVINAPSGGLTTTNGSSATYQVGNIYNGTGANFTVTGIVQSDTQVALSTVAGGTSAALFWKGGLSGATNVWAATNGISQSNWATDAAGTNTPNIPTSGTAVTFSATGATNQGAMTLGGDIQMASLTINDSAAVTLQNSVNTLTIAGAAAITTGASAGATELNVPLVLQNGTPTISLASANSVTLGGPISGAATTLTKAGAGTGSLILTGANTFAGAFNITTGIVRISNDSALGTTAGGTTVSSGATLEMLGGITVGAEALSLNGAGVGSNGALRSLGGNNIYNGAVTLAGNTTIQSDAGLLTLNGTITNGANLLTVQGAGNTTLTGVIGGGAGGLTKTGNGTLRVSAANTFTGAVNVNGGILTVANNTGLGTTAAGTTVTSGASLELQGNITVGAETLSLAGAGFASSGALRNLNGTNTYGGAVTLTADSTITSELGLLTLDVASGNAIAGTFNLTFNGAGSITVADPIATSTGTLTKNGTGLLILSGANTYTGTTTVTDGIVRLANATALSGGIGAASGLTGLTITGGGVVELGANDFSRGLGTGAANVQWTGSGGFGAFGAVRTVNLGGGSAAVTWASGNFVPNASELVLSSTSSTHTVTFTNPIALNGAVRTIRVNDGGAAIDAVISGAITGTSPAGLNKTGTGVLALNTGANSIGGPTTVQQGTLTVNSSLAGGGGVTVNSGARFNGGVAGTPASVTSPIIVQNGGSFSAGSSINSATGDGVGQMNASLTSGQIVDWQSGSNLVFDFRTNNLASNTNGTNWDYLNITGAGSALKIGNGLTLLVNSWNDALTAYAQNNSGTPANNFNPATSTSYSWLWVSAPGFLDASGSPLNDGELSNFNIVDDSGTAVFSPTGANYTPVGGSEFWVSKVGTGLYINYGIHAVPEPGSLMFMGLAGLGLGAYGWRRRKKQSDAVDAAASLDENGKSNRNG